MNSFDNWYNPFAHLENPELRDKKEDKKSITPEELKKTKEEAKKIFGSFNPETLKNIPKDSKEKIPEDPFEIVPQEEIDLYQEELINEDKIKDKYLKKIRKKGEKFNLNELLKNYNTNIENNPVFPIVERLYEQWKVSEKTINEIWKYLSNNENLDINKINFQNKKEKEILEWYLNNLNFNNLNREQNLLELTQDIKKIPTLKELKIEINNDWTFENEIFNKIGKNYLKIPDSNWVFDIEQDFSTAILTTKNEILKEVKNIKKDSETYRQAIKNINSWNLKKQLEWIESLYILAYSNEWVLWKKTIEAYKNSRKKTLIKEALKIEQTLQQQKLTEQEKEQIEQKKEQIKEELSEITWIKDWKKIEWGDIFKATKQEINDNGQIEKQQTI